MTKRWPDWVGFAAMGAIMLTGGAVQLGICLRAESAEGRLLRVVGVVYAVCGVAWLSVALRKRKGRRP